MAKLTISLSGLFFGGAIDHAILAMLNRSDTPYGVDVSVTGNWVLAALDLVLTAALWTAHRWFERAHQPDAG